MRIEGRERIMGGMESVATLPPVALRGRPERDASPGRSSWFERGPSGRLMLFSGRSNRPLAESITAALGIELASVELETFANGETYCRFAESVRGADVFFVQSCSPPVNDYLMELLIMTDAAKLASARRITAVMPWFPYSRQDKKSAPREPITAKLVAELLQTAGVDRVLTMDLHAGQIQGFFTVPVDHMTALPLFARYYRERGLSGSHVVSVSPDPGRAKMARRFANMLEADLAIMSKTRPAHDVAAVTQVIGDVRGKVAIMGDDMIVTGGTLLAGAEALAKAGAAEIHAFATHGLFPPCALERLMASEIVEIVVTDTVAVAQDSSAPRLSVVSVAELLAESIQNVFADGSVSAIFSGENELF